MHSCRRVHGASFVAIVHDLGPKARQAWLPQPQQPCPQHESTTYAAIELATSVWEPVKIAARLVRNASATHAVSAQCLFHKKWRPPSSSPTARGVTTLQATYRGDHIAHPW